MPDQRFPGPDEVLTERIRFLALAALVLFGAGWIAWFYPFDDLLDRNGTPLGADFSMFYVAGQVVWEGESEQLYNQALHQSRLLALFPGIEPDFALPYRYPPCVAAMMAPLSAFPYAAAYAVFLAFSAGAWWFATRRLVAICPRVQKNWQPSYNWLVLGWPVALETLVGGQASMFALCILVFTISLIRSNRLILAGAAIALAAYKPNVLALAALSLLIRYPKMLVGFIPVACLAGLLCLIPNGFDGLLQYRSLTSQLATAQWDVDTPYWKVHGLTSYFDYIFGVKGRLICGVIGMLVAVAAALHSRFQPTNQSIWLAFILSVNALFNSYTPIYDLVLLFAGLILSFEYVLTTRETSDGTTGSRNYFGIQIVLAAVCFGPHLSQAFAKFTGFQSFSLALLAFAAWQFIQIRRLPKESIAGDC